MVLNSVASAGNTLVAPTVCDGGAVSLICVPADDPEPPAPERYAVNFPNGAVKLSAAEWQSVKAKTGKYAELLSKG